MSTENLKTPFIAQQRNFLSYTTLAEADTILVFKNVGQVVYESSTDTFFYWNGSAWIALLTSGGAVSTSWGTIIGVLSGQTDLQNALNAKQNTITLGTTLQYFRGDLSLATFPTAVSTFTNDSGYLISSDLNSIQTDINTLKNNVYKVTYYEIISGTSGSITPPSGATINANEFGLSGNAILSKVDGSNKPTFQSPLTAGGVVVTASLNPLTGAYITSGAYTDSTVAIIYSVNITGANYHNLNNFYIVESEQKTNLVLAEFISSPLLFDPLTNTLSIQVANSIQSGFLSSTDWNTFNNKADALPTATVNTTTGALTTLQSIAIPTDTVVMVEARIHARKTGGAGAGAVGDGNGYVRIVKAKNVGGVVTIGLVSSSYTSEDIAPLNATLAVSGTNVIVQVNGSINNNITWTSSCYLTK